jgi:hypothetical protein
VCQTFELYRSTSTARAFGWMDERLELEELRGERQRGKELKRARQLRRCMIEIGIEIARNVYMHSSSALLLKEAYSCMYTDTRLNTYVAVCICANTLDRAKTSSACM